MTPRRRAVLAAVLAQMTATAGAGPLMAAEASAPAPDLTLAVRETAEGWRNLAGGVEVGDAVLSKLQVSATWTANRWGDPGLRVHLQLFRTDGDSLTARVGDLQTVSSIEAVTTTRLFEAWAEQGFGRPGAGGVAVRAGLIDLNSDFDSIDPASLFIDSSHGIGPEFSSSGLNGPSIFPVSALALRVSWTPTPDWTVRGGLFDGLAGDPDHPTAFVAARFGADAGALGVVEADRKIGRDAQFSLGAWGYSSRFVGLDGRPQSGEAGAFAFVEGPAPGLAGWSGWLRAGLGDQHIQVVSGYLGAGLVRKAPLRGRPDDQLGFAVSRAALSPLAQSRLGLRSAETTWEATYQVKAADWLAVQPDVQYVVHPSSRAGLPNALVVGLRLVLTAGYPERAPAVQQGDPTVAPDTPPAAPSA